MSLLSPDRVEAASKFLRELDVNAMLNAIDSPSRQGVYQLGKLVSEQASLSRRSSPGSIYISEFSSLQVTISSLVLPRNRDPSMGALWLNAISHDSTSRIQPFAQTLFQSFTAAGFLVAGQGPPTLSLCIIDMLRVKTQITYRNSLASQALGYDPKFSRRLDARKLIEKYKDYEWAADIRLEKLSICERGHEDINQGDGRVGRRYREIASIPLP